jgi:hypothetical protein
LVVIAFARGVANVVAVLAAVVTPVVVLTAVAEML